MKDVYVTKFKRGEFQPEIWHCGKAQNGYPIPAYNLWDISVHRPIAGQDKSSSWTVSHKLSGKRVAQGFRTIAKAKEFARECQKALFDAPHPVETINDITDILRPVFFAMREKKGITS